MPVHPASSLKALAEESGLHVTVKHVEHRTRNVKEYTVTFSHDPDGKTGHWIQSQQPEIIRTWLRGYKSGQANARKENDGQM